MLDGYEVVEEAERRVGIDGSRIRRLCLAGRWPGAVRLESQWLIPVRSWPMQSEYGPEPKWVKNRDKARGG